MQIMELSEPYSATQVSTMQISEIRLNNFRCHADLTLTFQEPFTLLVGINGSGKTSILHALAQSFSGLGRFLGAHRLFPLRDAQDIRLIVTQAEGRFRFEPQYPVRISIFGRAGDTAFRQITELLGPTSRVRMIGPLASIYRTEGEVEAGINIDFPIVAFYRASRQWRTGEVSEIQAATTRSARQDGYATWFDASLDASALQIWAIAKCLERFQVASEHGRSFDSIDDDELALVNGALSAAIESAKGLRYDLHRKALLVEWKDAHATPFEHLSDGQRAVVALVADIARRMCLLNPHLGKSVTRMTSGIVVIDELDMHLHPSWQRTLVRGLKLAFPAIQFVAASHSPQIIGELRPAEVVVLHPRGASRPQVSYGLDSSRVLNEIMEVSERTPAIDIALTELFKQIEGENLEDAKKLLDDLRRRAPDLPEYVRAEMLLKRKEILGR